MHNSLHRFSCKVRNANIVFSFTYYCIKEKLFIEKVDLKRGNESYEQTQGRMRQNERGKQGRSP